MSWAPFLAPERDGRAARGRQLLSGGTNHYVIPGMMAIGVGASGPGAGQDVYCFLYVDTPIIVDQLACEITAADSGKNTRIGMYAADRDWQPVGPPLADSGDISVTATGVKTYTPSTPLRLERGRYLGVTNSDGAPSYRFMHGNVPGVESIVATVGTSPYNVQPIASRAYAAFPTPGTKWTFYGTTGTTPTFGAFLFLRVTAP